MSELWYQIGIIPAGALGVVIASTLIYLLFTAVIARWRRYFTTANSSFAFALTVVLGAIMGRLMLGNSPTLVGGAIALGTLLSVQAIVNRVRQNPRFRRRGTGVRASVVMVHGRVEHEELRRLGVASSEIWVALRRAGIRNTDEIGAVLLEHDGTITVLQEGVEVDLRILAGTKGLDKLPAELLRA